VGYNTRIDLYDVWVRADKIEEVTATIAAHRNDSGTFHWMVGMLELGDDGSLTWDETSEGTWKQHEGFIHDLADWCSRGFVSFWSREGDGAAWAYEFDGVGGSRKCSARRVSALKAAAARKRNAAATKAAQI